MSFDIQKVLEGKRAFRRRQAALPIGEKLRMLDVLRQRELDIRKSRDNAESGALRETPRDYPSKDGNENYR